MKKRAKRVRPKGLERSRLVDRRIRAQRKAELARREALVDFAWELVDAIGH